jgi:hypothetical protein
LLFTPAVMLQSICFMPSSASCMPCSQENNSRPAQLLGATLESGVD